MSRLLGASVVAGLVLLSLGCSGVAMSPSGGGYDNLKACKAWVKKQNKLPCMKAVQLDPDEMCPASLDASPLDMTSYYRCMAKHAKCKGKLPDLGGQGECKPSM